MDVREELLGVSKGQKMKARSLFTPPETPAGISEPVTGPVRRDLFFHIGPFRSHGPVFEKRPHQPHPGPSPLFRRPVSIGFSVGTSEPGKAKKTAPKNSGPRRLFCQRGPMQRSSAFNRL